MEDPPPSSPTRAHPGSDPKRSELLLKCEHPHDERQKTLCGVLESALDNGLKLNLEAFECPRLESMSVAIRGFSG
jgi:hypothetical protein